MLCGLDKSRIHTLEFESRKNFLNFVGIGRWRQAMDINRYRGVATQNHKLCISQNSFTTFNQRLLQLRRLFIGMIKNSFNVLILHDQLRRSFFAHTRNTVKIVARVATQCRIVGILFGRHASSLQDSGFVIKCVVTNTTLVVQNPNVWIAHELIVVAVTGDDY